MNMVDFMFRPFVLPHLNNKEKRFPHLRIAETAKQNYPHIRMRAKNISPKKIKETTINKESGQYLRKTKRR
jgi:hypothetical protein